MNTQKISVMRLIKAELEKRVEHSEAELTKIDNIVRLSEVRVRLDDLQEARRKAAGSVSAPPPDRANLA